MKILLAMTSLALLFVLTNCDKKKDDMMQSDSSMNQQDSMNQKDMSSDNMSSDSTEEKTEESK